MLNGLGDIYFFKRGPSAGKLPIFKVKIKKWATPVRWVNTVPYPKGWRITGAFIMGQILNLSYAFKSCDSLFVLFLIVLSEREESAETARSSPLALSLTLPLPRSLGDIWFWRRCLYRGKKRGRFLLLDTKTGGKVNTQSIVRPREFFSAGNCQVSWWREKTLIRPSRRKNETSTVCFELRLFCSSNVFAHINNELGGNILIWRNNLTMKSEIALKLWHHKKNSWCGTKLKICHHFKQ